MNKEEKKVEEKVEEPKSTKLIDDANLAAKRLEAANTKQEELLGRQEQLEADRIIAGTTDAGQQPVPAETEDQKWAREAKIRYAGTGMDPTED